MGILYEWDRIEWDINRDVMKISWEYNEGTMIYVSPTNIILGVPENGKRTPQGKCMNMVKGWKMMINQPTGCIWQKFGHLIIRKMIRSTTGFRGIHGYTYINLLIFRHTPCFTRTLKGTPFLSARQDLPTDMFGLAGTDQLLFGLEQAQVAVGTPWCNAVAYPAWWTY